MDAFDCLVHAGLVNMPEYDRHLAKAVSQVSAAAAASDASSNSASATAMATQFAMHVCKIYLVRSHTFDVNFSMCFTNVSVPAQVDERAHNYVTDSDLNHTVDVLHKIATQSPHPPEGLPGLVDQIKMGGADRLEQQNSALAAAAAASGPTAQLHSGIQQAREFEDPPGRLILEGSFL